MERAVTSDQTYIKMTLQKFLKTNRKATTKSNKRVIQIDLHQNQMQKIRREDNFLQGEFSSSHKHNSSLQFYQSNYKNSQAIQGFSQKYSEFVNKIKFYNQSRLKTMEPLKIDKVQHCREASKDIYEQRIYKKAIQQKQKLYPFMQKRSKTQHQIKGTIKNISSKQHMEQMNNMSNFSPLDFKLSNHSEQEELLQQQKMKQKRFLIKTANRKILRRQLGSNHSVNINQTKLKDEQRKISRKRSQPRSTNSLDSQFKFVQQTIIQNRRLVPNMGILKSKQKTQQIRQKLRMKFTKYRFFDRDQQKIKYCTNHNEERYKVAQTKKLNLQFSHFNFNKDGLRGWDLPSQKNNQNTVEFQQF